VGIYFSAKEERYMRTKQKKAVAFIVSLCMSLYCIPLQFLTIVRADGAEAKAIYASWDEENESYTDFEFVDIGGTASDSKALLAYYVSGGEYTFDFIPDNCDVLVDNAEVSFDEEVGPFDIGFNINEGSINFDAVTVSAQAIGEDDYDAADAEDVYNFFTTRIDGRPYDYTATDEWVIPEGHEFVANSIKSEDYVVTLDSGVIVNDFQVSYAVINSEIRIEEGGQFGLNYFEGVGSVILGDSVYVYCPEYFLEWSGEEYVRVSEQGNILRPGRYLVDVEAGGFVYEEDFGDEAYVTVYYDDCNWSGSEAKVYIDGSYIEPDGSMTFEPGTTIEISLTGIDRYSEVEHIVEFRGDFEPLEYYVYDGETIEFELAQGGKYAIEIFWSDFDRQWPADDEFVIESNANGNGYIDLSDYDIYGEYVRSYTDPADPGHKKFIIKQDIFDEFLQVRFVIVPNEGETFERFVTDEGEFFADPTDEQNSFDSVLVFDDGWDQWCYEIAEVPERPWEPVRIAADFTGGGPQPGGNEIWINDHGFRPSVLSDGEFVELDDNRLMYDDLADMESITLGFGMGDHEAFNFMIRMDGFTSVVPFDEITDDYYVITINRPDEGWTAIHEFEVVDNNNTPLDGYYCVEWQGGDCPETTLDLDQPTSFEAGEMISFTAEHTYYALAIRTNSGKLFGVDYSEDEYCEYTPGTGEGFTFVFYMTEESYEFANLRWDDETERDIWFNFNHNGFDDCQVHDYLTITAGDEDVEYFVSGNQIRFVIDRDVEELLFSISDPSAADNYNYRIGPDNYNDSEATVAVDEWSSWLDFEIWFEKDFGGNEININDHGFAFSIFDGENYFYPEDNRLDYDAIEDMDILDLRFDGREDATIYGFKIKMNGYTLTVAPDIVTEDGVEYYCVPVERPEDGWRTIREIEVMDWEGPFNGQYVAEWKGYEPESSLIFGVPTPFEVGEPITFTIDSDFYTILIRKDSGEESEVSYDEENECYYYIPDTDEAFSITIYMERENYEFDHLDWNWDTECSLWFNFDHNGFYDWQLYEHLEILVNGEAVTWFASGNQVRLVLDKDVTKIRINLIDPDFEADHWGYWLDGEDHPDYVGFDVNLDLHDGDNWINDFNLYFERDGGYQPGNDGVSIRTTHGEDLEYIQYSLDGSEFQYASEFDGDRIIVTEDLTNVQTISILAPKGNEDPDEERFVSWYTQAHIQLPEIQHIVAMEETEDGFLLTIERPEEGWPGFMDIELTDFTNPLDFEYRYDVHTNGNPDIYVVGDDNSINNFEIGEPIEFEIEGGEPYMVVVSLNYAYNSDAEIPLEPVDGVYTYTPESSVGFCIQVYTDEAEWDWNHFWPDWEQGQFYYEFRFDHEGFDEISDIVSIDVVGDDGGILDGMAYGDRMRLILADGTQGLEFNINLPDEYDEYYYVINGEDYTEGTEFSVGVSHEFCDDLDLVLCKYNRVGLVLSVEEGINGLQYSTDGENFNDLTLVEDPEFPGRFWYVVPYEDIADVSEIFFKIVDPEYVGENYVQARILVEDQGYINSVPVGFEDGIYQFSIYREDGWPFVAWLEVNTWYELNFNEYRTVLVGDFFDSDVQIDGIPSDYEAVSYFNVDQEIAFTVTGDIYGVIVSYGDGWFDLESEDGSYSYTPDSNEPFEFIILRTEADWVFWTLETDEGQDWIEFGCYINDIDEVDTFDFISLDTDNEGIINYAANSTGDVKAVYSDDAETLYITLNPDVLPDGAELIVRCDGEDITADVINNGYTVEIPLMDDYIPRFDIVVFMSSSIEGGFWIEDSNVEDIWYALDDGEFIHVDADEIVNDYGTYYERLIPYTVLGDAQTITFKLETNEDVQAACVGFAGSDESSLFRVEWEFIENDGNYAFVTLDLGRIENPEYDTHVMFQTGDVVCDYEYSFDIVERGDVEITDAISGDIYDDGQISFFDPGAVVKFTVDGDCYKVVACPNFQEEVELTAENGVYSYELDSEVGVCFKIYTDENEYDYDHTQYPSFPYEYREIVLVEDGMEGLIAEEYVSVAESDDVADVLVAANREKVLVNMNYSSDVMATITLNIEKPEGCQIILVNGVEFAGGEYVWELRSDDYQYILEIVFYGDGIEPQILPGWHELEDGSKYYLTEDLVKATGLYEIDDKTYFFDDDGIMQTSWQTINSKWYYFGEDGAMLTDWQTIGGKWYYFDGNGVMATGWKKISSKWYYFTGSGAMVTGWKQISGDWYYFAGSGAMATGLQTLSGKKYFFGTDGIMKTGWQTVGSDSYYFQSSGVMATDIILSIESATFYFDENGKIVENQWISKDGSYYYAGDYGEIAKGLQKIGKATYYFDENGVMQKGWQQIDGKYYYFKSSGAMVTGLQTISGKKYYFNDQGVMQTGWIKIDDQYYYFASSGAMQTGWQKISGKWYLFSDEGVMLTGWQKSGSSWYYFQASGAMATGWLKISDKWYYFGSSGAMATNWQKIDGKWYYFGSSGVMATGWQEISGKWYYFKSGVMQTGTVKIGSKTYTFDSNGVWVS